MLCNLRQRAGRFFLEDRRHCVSGRVSGKCRTAREHFVEDGAETEYVGTPVHRRAAHNRVSLNDYIVGLITARQKRSGPRG